MICEKLKQTLLNHCITKVMDISSACNILELESTWNLSISQLKKHYHKMALQNHPDKNGNTKESTLKFQLIQEAYQVLKREIVLVDSENIPPSVKDEGYMFFAKIFLHEIIQGKYHEIILSIIETFISGCKEISLPILENLDQDTAVYIYDFFVKYKYILLIDDAFLNRMRLIILEKCSKTQLYILNPNLQDLLNNNIYKLVVQEKTYFVPLWHDEIYFQNDIVVKCIPELPENIELDENGNIHISLHVQFTFSLLEEKYLTITLYDKILEIPMDNLKFKKIQKYIFQQEGIAMIINEKNIYDLGKKTDIIVTVIYTK